MMKVLEQEPSVPTPLAVYTAQDVANLQSQLAEAREELSVKDQEIAAKDQELAERDKIIEVYDSNVFELLSNLTFLG